MLEIADRGVNCDRDAKGNGIQQYCRLNLQGREWEDSREPSPTGYRRKQTYAADERFTLAAFPKISIKGSDLVPPVKIPARRNK